MSDEQHLELARRASAGDDRSMDRLFAEHREKLRRMVHYRMDPRLRGRLDPSDIVQESCLEASERMAEYVANPDMPFYVWLRLLTVQRVILAQRHHLGVQARDARREVSLDGPALPGASSAALASELVGHLTSPSSRAMKNELRRKLEQVLNRMTDLDREILALKHFEQLTLHEAADILQIKHSAACNRYVRALERLRALIADRSDVAEDW